MIEEESTLKKISKHGPIAHENNKLAPIFENNEKLLIKTTKNKYVTNL